jgi:hypothetical protein
MAQMIVFRRFFLRTALSVLGCLMLIQTAIFLSSTFAASGGSFHHDGGLVYLPSHGELFVASDFHSRLADFDLWLSKTSVLERIKAGDDVYALILGDIVDMKPGDPQAVELGDIKIIRKIREFQETAGENGKRLIYLQGNHEHESIRLYNRLKDRHDLNDSNREELIQKLYQGPKGQIYQQFNCIERLNDADCTYLSSLPVAVIARNGMVFVHGGPSKSIRSAKEIAGNDKNIVYEILHMRPAPVEDKGYTIKDLVHFLEVMDHSSLLVTGHTPLDLLPPDWIRDGVGIVGQRAVLIGTSYNALKSGSKTYLHLDLSKKYESAAALKRGTEILELEPQQERTVVRMSDIDSKWLDKWISFGSPGDDAKDPEPAR